MKGKYCYSYDQESYTGEFETLEELFNELEYAKGEIHIGRYEERISQHVTGEDVLERIDEVATDNYNLQKSVFDYCDGDRNFLATQLQKVLDDFFEKHPIQYWQITDKLSEEDNDKIEKWVTVLSENSETSK